MTKSRKLLNISGILFTLSELCHIGYFYLYHHFVYVLEETNYNSLITSTLFTIPLIAFCFFFYNKQWGKYFYVSTYILFVANSLIGLISVFEYYSAINFMITIFSIMIYIFFVFLSFKKSKVIALCIVILNVILSVFSITSLFSSISISFRSFYTLEERLCYPLMSFSNLLFDIAILVFWYELFGKELLHRQQSKKIQKQVMSAYDVETSLIVLKSQFESGKITEEEYHNLKAQLITKL